MVSAARMEDRQCYKCNSFRPRSSRRPDPYFLHTMSGTHNHSDSFFTRSMTSFGWFMTSRIWASTSSPVNVRDPSAFLGFSDHFRFLERFEVGFAQNLDPICRYARRGIIGRPRVADTSITLATFRPKLGVLFLSMSSLSVGASACADPFWRRSARCGGRSRSCAR